MRNWVVRTALRIGARLQVWAYMQMGKDRSWSAQQMATARQVAMQEQNAIWESVLGVIQWNKNEHGIVTERLARRFDPGMTLNEVANRAIEAKKEVRSEPSLSATQLVALDFQRAYLERVVKKS